MPPTIKEIAKKAKVSIATVSRALNDDPRVICETKKFVLSIANEMNYNPNILARNFAKKKSNIIGLFMPEISDEFFTEIIKGVDEFSYLRGYYTMVVSSHKNRSLIESITTFMGNGLLGGAVLFAPTFTKEIEDKLNFYDIPVVLIGNEGVGKKLDTVAIDNYQGSFDITNYLIQERGYEKLAYICGPSNNYDAISRKKGFLDALKANRLSIDKSWILHGDFTTQAGTHACETLLKLKKYPEAIIAANDMMAIGCYSAIHEHSLKIPKDIGVIGFDDIFISHLMTPGLTTVKVHIYDVGKYAAKTLIERMESSSPTKPKRIKIPTELVMRKSC